MFDRLNKEDKRTIRHRLGDYVAHKVIRNYGVMKSVEEINSLNRMTLAREWYDSQVEAHRWNKEMYSRIVDTYFSGVDDFIRTLAIYIDSRIPGAYIKYAEHLETGVDDICVPFDEDLTLPYGLKYHYSENLAKHAPATTARATQKQIMYLQHLSATRNYHSIELEQLSKQQASACIDFFLHIDVKDEPECFSRHFKKGI